MKSRRTYVLGLQTCRTRELHAQSCCSLHCIPEKDVKSVLCHFMLPCCVPLFFVSYYLVSSVHLRESSTNGRYSGFEKLLRVRV
jgi:hypothetical protein